MVDDHDYEILKQFPWFLGTCGRKSYARNTSAGFMHRLIMATPRGLRTDHINENTLDNRRANLRICTAAENAWNISKPRIDNPHKGVHYAKRYKKYLAHLTANKHTYNLGSYETLDEALAARRAAEIKYWGAFAPRRDDN
jgi:hypothetical protein